MRITKEEVMSAVKNNDKIKVLKNDFKSDDLLFIEWKSMRFILDAGSNNEEPQIKDIKNDENIEGNIGKLITNDFTITMIASSETLFESETDTLTKYRIANNASLENDFPIKIIYREPVDIFQIIVPYNSLIIPRDDYKKFNKESKERYIYGAIMSMVLIASVTSTKLKKEALAFEENKKGYLKQFEVE